MASEKGPVATEAPLVPSIAPQTQTLSSPTTSTTSVSALASAPVSVESLKAEAARATQSLKRHREATPTSPTSAALAQFNPDLSPSKAARLAGLASRHPPAPLTGAAAFEDERRRQEEQYKLQVSGASDNPAYKVQSELLSASALAMSRPQDAPGGSSDTQSAAPTSASSASNPATNTTTTTTTTTATATTTDADVKADISPQSASSIATLASGGAPVTESPVPMDVDARDDHGSFGTQPPAPMEESKATSLSYPGMIQSPQMTAPTREMSLPVPPRSPNSKRHKCPYCETEFTRHHNLKSHLLTHSQEKPYVCQTCQMRFRRLHDLKRHSKLHTGEKPHVCPKCDRKFARGDALARHSKGPGGCVGRRSSMGSSFLGDEDLDGASRIDGDSTMADVTYDGTSVVDMTEEERRRLSMPSIKAQQVQGNATAPEGYTPYSRTYPFPGSSGRLYPPNVDHGSTSSNASHTPGTSISSLPVAGGSAAMYPQGAITESPKPLSPGIQGHDSANANRQRSPSLTQFSQQHFARHQSDRQTPPVPSFTAADAARYAASAAGAQANAPGTQSVVGNAAGGAAPEGTSAAGQNGGSGDSSSNNLFATDHGIWVYVHSLEDQFRQLSERVQAMESTERTQEEQISYLTSQVTLLRGQLDAKTETAQKID